MLEFYRVYETLCMREGMVDFAELLLRCYELLTRNEILYSLNKPDDFVLAIVEFTDGDSHKVHYVRQPFKKEPDFGVTSVNYSFAELLGQGGEPS